MATKHAIGKITGTYYQIVGTPQQKNKKLSKHSLFLSFLCQYVYADTLTKLHLSTLDIITSYYFNNKITATLSFSRLRGGVIFGRRNTRNVARVSH